MKFDLKPLPYSADALAPCMSKLTLDYHYGKHYVGYVQNLNKLVIGTEWENSDIEKIIRESTGGLFNNAAQVWNHSFFFDQFTAKQTDDNCEPKDELLESIEVSFGSFGSFKEQFAAAAISQFGSGWVWVVKVGKELEIKAMSNADTPIKDGEKPILTLDVWEHAYYLDYYNSRANYIVEFWKLIDWCVIKDRFLSI